MANAKVNASINRSAVEDRKPDLPKKKRRKVVSKIYGATPEHLVSTPIDKQSTKVTTEDSEIIKVGHKNQLPKTLEPSDE